MKVLFDHQVFQDQIVGGISRYYIQIFKQYQDQPDFDFEVALKLSNNQYITELSFLKHATVIQNKQFKGLRRILNYFNEKNSIDKLRGNNFTLFHPTYYDPYFLKYLDNKPFVLTVYDLINEIFKFSSKKNEQLRQWKKETINRADKIIAISNNTKMDLMKIFNVPESKIQVIYLANSLNLDSISPLIKKEAHLYYLLYVGKRSGYKNFEFTVRSIANILIKENLFLICLGGDSFSKTEKEMLQELNLSNKVYHYFVNDAELIYFYSHAIALIFPSLYEGFGIPILEAFACKCPVIASNASSLPEVGGNACIYFNPRDTDELVNCVQQVIQSDHLRQQLILKGDIQLKCFSWETTALQTRDLYNALVA